MLRVGLVEKSNHFRLRGDDLFWLSPYTTNLRPQATRMASCDCGVDYKLAPGSNGQMDLHRAATVSPGTTALSPTPA